MAYKAIKPVRFDRQYSIGETIPDAVVDPARAPNLQAMGMIMPMPKEELPKADQRPQKIASDDGGVKHTRRRRKRRRRSGNRPCGGEEG